MKKKHTTRSAFFNPRVILSFVFCSIGVLLALLGFGAFSNVFAEPKASAIDSAAPQVSHPILPATNGPSEESAPFSPADKNGRFVYLIEFSEPGMLHRQGHAPGERFRGDTPQARANRDQVIAEQTAHVQRMAHALGRTPDVTHHFLVTHSGIATRLTPAEAQIVRTLPGVVSIERERLYKLDTYRSPAFIGANTIWDGSAVPGGVGTRGQGIVIAMLDTGVDPTHPSFANDAACGHGQGGAPNKLISFLDCATTDGAGLCNGPSPADTAGHGSHTASTAGGNSLTSSAVPPPAPPPPATEISGVATCANIRAYKVCPDSCPGADIQAGMNSVLLHGDVSVMNFSISGGTSPWNDNDRRKLDLVDADVLVAASAGNTSATITDPVGQVNHRGPWILTVAASTRDGGDFAGRLSASGPGTPPPETVDILMDRGSASPLGTPLTNHPMRHFTLQDIAFEGCTAGEDGAPADLPAFPAGFFTGSTALIHRGNCPFTKKITNAFNAGAAMVVIRNNVPAAVSMDTTGQPDVPAYSIDQAPGDALVAFVDANPATATINFELIPSPGDLLAGFSFRGPVPGNLRDLTKPDITGPGVDIYAAVPGTYGVISGTSMSSPHTAGSAALVRKVQPAWTVSEVKSALMMTAFGGGFKENGTTAWDADDVGSGRIDLSRAARAGVVMDETFANYLASNPATGGDPKTLNLPSVRNMNCTPSCTWTRTVRNTQTVATSWTAAGHNITPGFDITVQPTSFNFTGNLTQTQVLTITATPNNVTVPIAFGEVLLNGGVTGEGGLVLPEQHITVAINGPLPTPTPTPTVGPTATPGGSPTATPTGTPGGGVTPTPTATPNTGPAQALNLATRLRVQGGDNVGIGGFIVTGTAPKQVLIRGIGPSLANFGVPDPLANPMLILNGQPPFATITNNNWKDTQQSEIEATLLAPTNDLESAILVTLDPGSYTAILQGQDGGSGVALVEIYDLSQASASKLGNIATRAFVNTGNDIVIAGFILGNGTSNDKVVVRGIGPSLTEFGVPNALANPNLELRDGNGGLVLANDNWQDTPAQAAELTALNLAPTNALESAMVANLGTGAYTALLSGVGNGTGNALVEVYDNPVPGTGGTPTPTPGGGTPTPTPTPGGGTPTPSPTAAPPCTEAFDGVTAPALPAGWAASNPDPGDGIMWTTSTTSPDTAPNSAFINDQDGVADKVLDSKPITINSATATVTFRNNFDTEFSDGIFWDGGVLEISSPNINGGDFVDVTDPAVGGSIPTGGYTGEISGDASNPLAGRMAWSGSSGGYITSVVNLGSNVNGQTITLRFRMGTDEAVVAPGWNVDTISVAGGSCP